MSVAKRLALAAVVWLLSVTAEASAPTFVSYNEPTNFTSAATTKATVSAVSWNDGDIIVVVAGAEGANGSARLGTPTATGLTFTKRAQNVVSSTCEAFTATAVASGSGSDNVTVTSSTSQKYGFGVWVWRDSAGIGNNAEQHTATKTKALVPVGADSAILWGIFDFNAETVHTITPTVTTTREATQSSPNYTVHVADLFDQTSAGSVSYGISGGSSTGPYTIVIQEVQAGAGAGTTTHNLLLLGVGP